MSLDEFQKHASSSEAPIQLTLAGPGSGKTTTLVARFGYLVRNGVDPRRILAVTFTKKAADEMRDRVGIALEGMAQGWRPDWLKVLSICTFHSFALGMLRRDASGSRCSGLKPGFQVLADTRSQRRVLTDRGCWWNESGDIFDIISQCKERLVSAAAFAAEIRQDPDRCGERMWRNAMHFYEVYEGALREEGSLDFSDFVPRLVEMMDEHDHARHLITSSYDHLLVDEYQDVNPGQSLLIDRFVEDGVSLWAVGDDDQTLYSFRSSDVKSVLKFEPHFTALYNSHGLNRKFKVNRGDKPVMIHHLGRNYRSHPSIVKAGLRIIRQNRSRLDKPLVPSRKDIVKDDPVNRVGVFGFPNSEEEANQTAKAIKMLLDGGVPPEEIAVLYRVSSVAHQFAVAMVAHDIPFTLRGGGDIFQSNAGRLLRGAILFAFGFKKGESILGNSYVAKNLKAQMLRLPVSMLCKLETVQAYGIKGDTEFGKVAHTRIERDYMSVLSEVSTCVKIALFEIGNGAVDPEDVAAFSAAMSFLKLFGSIEGMEKGVADLSASLDDKPEGVVVLSTIHKAKGLEWDWIWLPGWEENLMPHSKSVLPTKAKDGRAGEKGRKTGGGFLDDPGMLVRRLNTQGPPIDPEEEERRIAYVGITRARRGLCLTYSCFRNGELTRFSPYLKFLTGERNFGFSLAPTPRPGGEMKDPEVLVVKHVKGRMVIPMTRSMIQAAMS